MTNSTYPYDPTVKSPYVSIYILCYNEEVMLPHTISFYKRNFPNSVITILDNQSTDRTRSIALELNCEVDTFDTQNQISDVMYQYLKNNHWKKATTGWCIICDADEWLQISEGQLHEEDTFGTTVISSEAWNMINMENNLDIPNIKNGYRDNDVCQFYDKPLLFNKTWITDMNYWIGGHRAQPAGKVTWSKRKYPLYHYKYLSPDYQVERYKMYASRLSAENLKNNWGANYLETEATLRALFEEYRKKSSQIL